MDAGKHVLVEASYYEELVKGKTVADALTAFIHDRKKRFLGIAHSEIEVLDILYFVQDGEEE